jgi:pimeloyl-ACP methyl ester carboxylesterase
MAILVCSNVLQARQVRPKLDPRKAKALYTDARLEYDRFEKAHGNYIQTKNVLMHYLTWGRPTGIPFIWAHGSLTNAYELLTIADSLAQKGYYVIAIDYYGHGRTDIPDHPVSLYHVADDLKFLIDKLKIKKAIVGGWSRGGFIATAFYDAYPQHVLALVLEDGGSVATNTYYHRLDSAQLDQKITDLFKERMIDTSYASEFDAYYDLYDTVARGTQFESLHWVKKNKEGRWAVGPGLFEFFNMRNPKQFANNILRPTQVPLFAQSMAIFEPKIIFRNLHVPMLILDPVSEGELFPFEKENALLKQQHPRLIQHEIFENTGHNIHYERKEKFTQTILSFLEKVKKHH